MNWDLVWSVVGGIGLGALTNELCDLSPWIARRVLGRAARIEAATREEAELIYAELVSFLEDVPGKLSKLGWSFGRMAYSLHHFARPSVWRRLRRIIYPPWQREAFQRVDHIRHLPRASCIRDSAGLLKREPQLRHDRCLQSAHDRDNCRFHHVISC